MSSSPSSKLSLSLPLTPHPPWVMAPPLSSMPSRLRRMIPYFDIPYNCSVMNNTVPQRAVGLTQKNVILCLNLFDDIFKMTILFCAVFQIYQFQNGGWTGTEQYSCMTDPVCTCMVHNTQVHSKSIHQNTVHKYKVRLTTRIIGYRLTAEIKSNG